MKSYKEWSQINESGGSFDYLYSKDFELAINNDYFDKMMAAIKQLNNPIANQKINQLLQSKQQLTHILEHSNQIWSQLQGLMRAIEWEHSGDGGDINGELGKLK